MYSRAIDPRIKPAQIDVIYNINVDGDQTTTLLASESPGGTALAVCSLPYAPRPRATAPVKT